jgi:hypothetical protein
VWLLLPRRRRNNKKIKNNPPVSGGNGMPTCSYTAKTNHRHHDETVHYNKIGKSLPTIGDQPSTE